MAVLFEAEGFADCALEGLAEFGDLVGWEAHVARGLIKTRDEDRLEVSELGGRTVQERGAETDFLGVGNGDLEGRFDGAGEARLGAELVLGGFGFGWHGVGCWGWGWCLGWGLGWGWGGGDHIGP